MRDHYVVGFDINDDRYYTIWYTDDTDGFITENERLLYFKELSDLKEYAHSHELPLGDGIAYFNGDRIIGNTDPEINCSPVLDFWNIISDMAGSLHIKFSGDDKAYNTEYAKLISGCGLPALEHGHFEPEWTKGERDNIKRIISEGTCILNSAFNATQKN